MTKDHGLMDYDGFARWIGLSGAVIGTWNPRLEALAYEDYLKWKSQGFNGGIEEEMDKKAWRTVCGNILSEKDRNP